MSDDNFTVPEIDLLVQLITDYNHNYKAEEECPLGPRPSREEGVGAERR